MRKRSRMKPASPAASVAGSPGSGHQTADAIASISVPGPANACSTVSTVHATKMIASPMRRADPIHQRAGRNLPDHHPEVERHGDVGVLRVGPLELAVAQLATAQHRQHLAIEQVDGDRGRQQPDDRPARRGQGTRAVAEAGSGRRWRSWRWKRSWVSDPRQLAATSVHCRVLADRCSASSTCCRTSASAKFGMEVGAAREALEELGERGDERVLVADDVAGPPEVAEDRVLHVGHEQVARPLLDRRHRRIEELEVIEALEVESQHAAGAVDLERVPRSGTRCRSGSPRTCRRCRSRTCTIAINASSTLRSGRERPRIGDALGDRPVEIQRRVEQVRRADRRRRPTRPAPDPSATWRRATCRRPTAAGRRRCSGRSCRAAPRRSAAARRRSPARGGS